MQKELTIVISAYNKELYLDRCIGSLLSSSLDRLEIILVNDGSSDRTSEIAHAYESQHPDSIVVVDKANGDQGSCINVGLKLFRGRYFKTLDADDYLDT
ncbi:MAG: glycosyltransferase family A protein [Rikenellaceae bacterium]